MNNVTLLAKVAKEFRVPAMLTAVETESFSGYVWPQLLDVFPGQTVIERSSMNSWNDAGFRQAIDDTGRKNILLTGLWTEVCVAIPIASRSDNPWMVRPRIRDESRLAREQREQQQLESVGSNEKPRVDEGSAATPKNGGDILGCRSQQ